MTNTNTQFKSKEHYLAFLQAWSTAVNSEKGKTHYVERKWTHGSTTETFNEKVDGWLTSAHHVMYNMLRGRTFHKGFTMTSNRNKLLNGMSPCAGLYHAVNELKHIQKLIRQEAEHEERETTRQQPGFLKKKEPRKEFWGTKHLDDFLAPFNGIIDRDMIMELNIPEVRSLYTSCGQGARVVVALLEGDQTPKTYDDLLKIIAEVE